MREAWYDSHVASGGSHEALHRRAGSQTTLLPDCIDDYVDEDNSERAVDAFVKMLDLAELDFAIEPDATGRPGYHPATMLKLYVYGYLNQVQSSRRLERECGRNLELIWLMGRLKPDFKAIADFRRDNGPAIRKVCRQFVALCRDIDLLDVSLVAIDGSKFKAVNAKARSYTRGKLRRRLGEIDAAIERYMGELDRADEVLEKTGMHPARMSRVIKKLAHYRKEARTMCAIEERMDATGETQVSLTDPDCRAMASTSKQPRVVGYDLQSAVETKHHLIVAHEVTNLCYDRDALSMMAHEARDAMASDTIEAIAELAAHLQAHRRCRAPDFVEDAMIFGYWWLTIALFTGASALMALVAVLLFVKGP